MNRESRFSYQCNQCGRCCHDQVITLSPWDVLRIARAAGVTTGEAVARYTERRGSLLKFGANGGCVALDGVRCTLHRGRPLACRLYPLALERDDAKDGTPDNATEQFVTLEPAGGSLGVFANNGTVGAFLAAQGVPEYLEMNTPYARMLPAFRRRVADLVDFDTVEPREFWRRAVAEALRESGFDANPLIDALFDSDALGCGRATDADTVAAHVRALETKIRAEVNPEIIAAAAVMLAVSLGYSPEDAMSEE
ncbi:MAG: YkgJ family cysteine cluster protein [Candidatus Binataceae bacterium]